MGWGNAGARALALFAVVLLCSPATARHGGNSGTAFRPAPSSSPRPSGGTRSFSFGGNGGHSNSGRSFSFGGNTTRSFGGTGGHTFGAHRGFGGNGSTHTFGNRTFGSTGGAHSFGTHSNGGRAFGGHGFGNNSGAGRHFGSGGFDRHGFGNNGGRHFGSGGHGFAAHGIPRRVAGGARYFYHGHAFNRFRGGFYRWPHGYRYVHYAIGGYLPRVYWLPDYYITDYADYGLDDPPADYIWMRYGPDLVLFDEETGEIAQVVPGAFEETADAGDDTDGDQ